VHRRGHRCARPVSPRPGRRVAQQCMGCPRGAGTTRRRPQIAISRSRQVFSTSGSGCDVHGGPRPAANTADLIGAGVAKLGPGTPAAPAIPRPACVGEAEWGWWGGGCSVPPLEHLTALRSVVGRAAGPAHRAALTGNGWRAVGHAGRRRERGGQQQR